MDKSSAGGVPPRSVVSVLDQQALRRAALCSLMAEWAEAGGVSLLPGAPDMLPPPAEAGLRCPLVVLSLGGLPLRESPAIGWLQRLAQALPGTPVAVISDREAAEDVVAALRAGARGFVPTSIEPDVALHAFTFIMRGGSYFPPGAVLGRSPNGSSRGGPAGGAGDIARDVPLRSRPTGLATRQQAILALLREGRSNKLIGQALGMRESTVKVHVRRILQKLGASNRTQAALAAFCGGARDAGFGSPLHVRPVLRPRTGTETSPRQTAVRAAPGAARRPLKGVA